MKTHLRELSVCAIILAVRLAARIPIVVKWDSGSPIEERRKMRDCPDLPAAYDARSANPSRDAA